MNSTVDHYTTFSQRVMRRKAYFINLILLLLLPFLSTSNNEIYFLAGNIQSFPIYIINMDIKDI